MTRKHRFGRFLWPPA